MENTLQRNLSSDKKVQRPTTGYHDILNKHPKSTKYNCSSAPLSQNYSFFTYSSSDLMFLFHTGMKGHVSPAFQTKLSHTLTLKVEWDQQFAF